MAGRDAAIDDGLLVRAIHPVIVRFQERAVPVVKVQGRIGQPAGYVLDGWTESANDYFLGSFADDDGAGEKNVVE